MTPTPKHKSRHCHPSFFVCRLLRRRLRRTKKMVLKSTHQKYMLQHLHATIASNLLQMLESKLFFTKNFTEMIVSAIAQKKLALIWSVWNNHLNFRI